MDTPSDKSEITHSEKQGIVLSIIGFVDHNYKKLIFIPITLLILSLIQISYQTATTGDFINRGISLKGGITLTVPLEKQIDLNAVETSLKDLFPRNEINVRSLASAGQQAGIVVESDFGLSDQLAVNKTLEAIGRFAGSKIIQYNIEGIGSSLSSSFFREIIFALVIAFIFMSIVVIITFRTPIPSGAVILSAFADIVITIAVVNLLGIKLETGAIAAYLMLIGYSVDTDILLTTKMVRSKEGSTTDRVRRAMFTGLMMTSTVIVAVTAALIFSHSDTIRQMMTILLIGCFADIINTWITNVAILRWYVERKRMHHEHQV
jgi:preprotein translocase subunit SecF